MRKLLVIHLFRWDILWTFNLFQYGTVTTVLDLAQLKIPILQKPPPFVSPGFCKRSSLPLFCLSARVSVQLFYCYFFLSLSFSSFWLCGLKDEIFSVSAWKKNVFFSSFLVSFQWSWKCNKMLYSQHLAKFSF